MTNRIPGKLGVNKFSARNIDDDDDDYDDDDFHCQPKGNGRTNGHKDISTDTPRGVKRKRGLGVEDFYQNKRFHGAISSPSYDTRSLPTPSSILGLSLKYSRFTAVTPSTTSSLSVNASLCLKSLPSNSRPEAIPSTSYAPVSSTSYEPVPSTSYEPVPSTSYEPVPSTSYEPVPSTSYEPVPSTSYEPTPSTSCAPEPSTSYEPVPSTSYEPTPSTSYEPVPSTSYEPVPSTSYEPTPSTSYEPVPSISYEPVPSTSYEPVPSTSYEPVPSTSYEPVPSTSYEPVPSTSYEPTPSTSYEPVPSTSYEPTPSTSYEPVPSTSYEPVPSTIYEPVPSTIYEPVPSTSYEPVPSTSYEPVPSTSYEPVPSTSYEPVHSTSYEPVQSKSYDHLLFTTKSRHVPYRTNWEQAPYMPGQSPKSLPFDLSQTRRKRPAPASSYLREFEPAPKRRKLIDCGYQCPCKDGGSELNITPIPRQGRVIENLYQKLLTSRVLSRAKAVGFHCCEYYCSENWFERRDPFYGIIYDYLSFSRIDC